MKPEMRQQLARLSFEEKIRKVSELIRLSRKIKSSKDDAVLARLDKAVAELDAGYRRSRRLTDAEAIESGMQEKRKRFVGKRKSP